MRRPWPTGGCRAKNKQTSSSYSIQTLHLITLNDTHTHTHTHTRARARALSLSLSHSLYISLCRTPLEEGKTRRRKKTFSAEYKPFSLLIHVTYYGAEHGEIGVHVWVLGECL